MRTRRFALLGLSLALAVLAARALPFTYQGRLLQAGQPVLATMDLQFSLFTAESGGLQVGSTVTQDDVAVANGLFTVTLDFGDVFDGTDRWLAVAARPGGSTGSYTALTPRQRVTFAPNASYAAKAGIVPWSGISGAPAVWRLDGNAGITADQFLGTTDTQPLRFKVNNTLALRLEPPSASFTGNPPNLIGGYSGNSVGNYAYASVVFGGTSGQPNTVNYAFSTVAGGTDNLVNEYYSTIIGGYKNRMYGSYAVAGGRENTVSGQYATALGYGNTASNSAAVALGYGNTASGIYSVALGVLTTASGNNTFAAGQSASTNGFGGSFVWGDNSTSTVVNATANNQFTVRAAGGLRFYTNAALTSGITLAAGGSAWNVVSDRNAKAHFAAVNPGEILRKVSELPLTTWNYKAQDPAFRHLGPMAQDFHAAFGLGEGDDKVINTLDLDGVALAAIQGLCRELAQRDAAIAELQRKAQESDRRLEALEWALHALQAAGQK